MYENPEKKNIVFLDHSLTTNIPHKIDMLLENFLGNLMDEIEFAKLQKIAVKSYITMSPNDRICSPLIFPVAYTIFLHNIKTILPTLWSLWWSLWRS
jgi:hypothetical protein